MKSARSWVSLFALLLLNVSCSNDAATSTKDAADLPQSEADLQAPRAAVTPVISQRTYTSGNAIVKVTGSFQVDATIPINTQASTSDGEMTWLQFGASGSAEPNSLVTISPDEVGLSASLGKKTALAGADACEGSMQVSETLISGKYRCVDAASHDPEQTSGFGVGKVTIDISFTAGS